MPKTTEQFPVHVVIGKASEGRYLFAAEMSKEQLDTLAWLVEQHLEFRGKHHAVITAIRDAIRSELASE